MGMGHFKNKSLEYRSGLMAKVSDELNYVYNNVYIGLSFEIFANDTLTRR